MGKEILERSTIHAGKVFIESGQPHANAYIVQTGEIKASIVYENKKVEVTRFVPGDIIGETGLLSDDPATMAYEAVVDTTVIKITRQDFSKKIKKTDPMVKRVLEHMVRKLYRINKQRADEAEDKAHIDHEAMEIVDYLTRNLNPQRKKDYEDAMLPHFNALVTSVRDIRQRHRLEDFQAETKEDQKPAASDDDAEGDEAPEDQTDQAAATEESAPEDEDSFATSVS